MALKLIGYIIVWLVFFIALLSLFVDLQEVFNGQTVDGDKYRHRPWWYLILTKYLLPNGDLKPIPIAHPMNEVTEQGKAIVLRELNRKGNLNAFGKLFAWNFLAEAQEQRDCVLDSIEKRKKLGVVAPNIPPIIVVGMPRSGTTFLHRLLSLDEENFRAPRFHEYMNSCPRPAYDGGKSFGFFDWIRVQIQSQRMGAVRFLIPTMSEKHHIDGTLPEEDVIPLGHVFASAMLPTIFDVGEAYYDHLRRGDVIRNGLSYLKDYLEVHMRVDDRPFLLKTPQHTFQLKELLETFPNSRIIWTHRDPAQTIPSLVSVTFSMWGMGTDSLKNDNATIAKKAEELLSFWHWALNKGVQDRKLISNNTIIDVNFKQLTQSPVEQVKRIYKELKLELKPHVLNQMKQFELDWLKHGQSGKHSYSLKDLGLDEGKVRKGFQAYYDLMII